MSTVRKKSTKAATNKVDSSSHPASNAYYDEVMQLKATIPHWDNLFSDDAQDCMQDEWIRVHIIGKSLVGRFSWAIPNEKSLDVLSHFSPLVEIGAGKGYWGYLLRSRGVDILCYDKEPSSLSSAWIDVLKGGPSVLRKMPTERNLFLSYPDEDGSMAIECLNHFKGDYVIHVGELIHFGSLAGTIISFPSSKI